MPPTRPAAEYPVDQYINDKLARLGTGTAAPCDDATFLRRVSLDLTGRIPTAAEAKSFLENVRSDKRAQAIDRLLASPQFADYWALKWSDLLRVEEKLLDPQGVDTFHGWIRDAFAQAKPLDQFVRELITARGSTYAVPAANFYRAMRDPLTRGETVAQVFLGVRLQCAKCHNHPFDRWTQDDYYQWAALFARIDYEIVENNRPDRFDKHSFLGEQIVRIANKGEVINARTGREASPRLLGDATTTIDPQHDRLKQLAQWLASPENRPFARAQANRLWYHLMGRGLVEPIDDFRVTNPASHPQLLEYLTDELIRSQFDVRHVLRTIALSDAYQRSSRIKNADPLLTDNYAVTKPRRLTAEQLLDSQCQSLGTAAKFQGYEQQLRAVELPGIRRVRLRDATPSPDDRFLKTFGKPMRLLPCECERSDETTLNQALLLVSGRAFHRRLNDPNGRLAKWLADGLSDNSFVTQFYWSALTRAPTEAEQASFMAYIARTPNRLRAWQDVAWAVLNSKEFMFRF